jgi:hypothetical protein
MRVTAKRGKHRTEVAEATEGLGRWRKLFGEDSEVPCEKQAKWGSIARRPQRGIGIGERPLVFIGVASARTPGKHSRILGFFLYMPLLKMEGNRICISDLLGYSHSFRLPFSFCFCRPL